jgi:mRNA interferase YafQ
MLGFLPAIIIVAEQTMEQPLPYRNRNHKLKGEYIGYWECHIEPDWLPVYKKTETHIIFSRTGSHSDLF